MLKNEKINFIQLLLIALCFSSVILIGEISVVMFVKPSYVSSLRIDGAIFSLFICYAALYLSIAAIIFLVSMVLVRFGNFGKRLSLFILFGSFLAPLVYGCFFLRSKVTSYVFESGLKWIVFILAVMIIFILIFLIRKPDGEKFKFNKVVILFGSFFITVLSPLSTFYYQCSGKQILWMAAIFSMFLIIIISVPFSLLTSAAILSSKPSLRTNKLIYVLLLYFVLLIGLAYIIPIPRKPLGTFSNQPDFSKPSVLLIVTDTLRYDHTIDVSTAPNLIAFADDSIRFERNYATSSWTVPSFASILTSSYPIEHRAGFRGPVTGAFNAMKDSLGTIAELLRDYGFVTAAILTNAYLSEKYGFGRGFEQYENLLSHQQYLPLVKFLDGDSEKLVVPGDHPYLRANKQTSRIFNAVQRAKDSGRPFFILAHYMDPHSPYAAPEPFSPTAGLDSCVTEQYRSEVRYFDDEFGNLIDKLKGLGVYNDLLIVFTSDHGEELDENRPCSEDCGGGLHGHTLFEEQIHVPLIVKLPGNEAAGTVESDRLTTIIDIAPTILGVLDIPSPDNFKGVDLLNSELKDNNRVVFSEATRYGPQQKSVIDGFYKVIAHKLPPSINNTCVFNLQLDPHEKKSICKQAILQNDASMKFTSLLERIVVSLLEIDESKDRPVELTPMHEKQLKSLGYIM